MITVNDAFWTFRTRLETTDTEGATASRRQQKLRQQLDAALDIITDFLTGAYRRHTMTKPLRDVDIMIVLRDTSYLNMHPRQILAAVRDALAAHYGRSRVRTDRRAVRVDFGVEHVDDLTGEVISFDVVPAFEDGDHYLIPDDTRCMTRSTTGTCCSGVSGWPRRMTGEDHMDDALLERP
jgi:Second Messenger Oligonucleotide or Dinucleotide Synthetase domain